MTRAFRFVMDEPIGFYWSTAPDAQDAAPIPDKRISGVWEEWPIPAAEAELAINEDMERWESYDDFREWEAEYLGEE